MMFSFFQALQTNPFLQSALFASLFASIASGLMGPYVVVKKISSISGSIAHTILGGIGISLWLQYNFHFAFADPLYGAIVFALLSACAIGWVHLKYHQKEDTMIAIIWTSGMALGVLFVSSIRGYSGDFTNLLFGNILFVNTHHLFLLGCLDVLICLVLFFFHKKFLAICFDEKQAILQGLPVKSLYFLLLGLISLSIVLLIQVIGVILAMTLLTLPAALAFLFTKRFSLVFIFSILICLFCNFVGSWISYEADFSPGATISLLMTVFYLSSLLFKKRVA